MHADAKVSTDEDVSAALEGETGGVAMAGRPRVTHSIMDVLYPANPPQPRNARVIRLFDIEARPEGERAAPVATPAVSAAPARAEPTSREAARALRRGSLLAAAGGLR